MLNLALSSMILGNVAAYATVSSILVSVALNIHSSIKYRIILASVAVLLSGVVCIATCIALYKQHVASATSARLARSAGSSVSIGGAESIDIDGELFSDHDGLPHWNKAGYDSGSECTRENDKYLESDLLRDLIGKETRQHYSLCIDELSTVSGGSDGVDRITTAMSLENIIDLSRSKTEIFDMKHTRSLSSLSVESEEDRDPFSTLCYSKRRGGKEQFFWVGGAASCSDVSSQGISVGRDSWEVEEHEFLKRLIHIIECDLKSQSDVDASIDNVSDVVDAHVRESNNIPFLRKRVCVMLNKLLCSGEYGVSRASSEALVVLQVQNPVLDSQQCNSSILDYDNLRENYDNLDFVHSNLGKSYNVAVARIATLKSEIATLKADCSSSDEENDNINLRINKDRCRYTTKLMEVNDANAVLKENISELEKEIEKYRSDESLVMEFRNAEKQQSAIRDALEEDKKVLTLKNNDMLELLTSVVKYISDKNMLEDMPAALSENIDSNTINGLLDIEVVEEVGINNSQPKRSD